MSLITQVIKPDLATAERFLNRIGWPHTFQIFADDKTTAVKPCIIHTRQFADVAQRLVRLNDAGAGIFIMVNAGDGRGRSAKNVTRVRALFVDGDDVPIPAMWHRCPDMVCWREDTPGPVAMRWHAYWLTKPGEIPLDRFEACQRRLAAHYKTDPGIHDLPRVMRVPGFLHGKAEPQPVYCYCMESTTWK